MADLSIQGLCALLHLASPQLPVGGFSYSQGLEAAIEHGLVTDAGTARTWIADALAHGFARCEAPLWLLLRRAWSAGDEGQCTNGTNGSSPAATAARPCRRCSWAGRLHSLLRSVPWGGEAFAPRIAQLGALV